MARLVSAWLAGWLCLSNNLQGCVRVPMYVWLRAVPSRIFWAANTCGKKVAVGSGAALAQVDGSILLRRGYRRAPGPTFCNTPDWWEIRAQ